MALKELKSEADFKAFISENGLRLVHFSASWAPACSQLNSVLEALVAVGGAAVLDAEQVAAVSLAHNISAAPTLLFFKNGKEVDRVDGFQPGTIKQKLLLHGEMAGVATKTQVKEDVKEDLNTRLKRLIESHRLMLFMKGNPDQPRCGFSRQTVALLQSENLEFGTFDILEDEEVRQGLKTYSNWPTFPQLYFDGELLGGLDVIREEMADKEFVGKLPKKLDAVGKLNARLAELVKKSPLMLFMKGNRQQPRCGFSRTTVKMLDDLNAEYETFDILEDEDVRQGLKTYSNWPTFPQIYLNGELIGGLDILAEEIKDADFLSKLPKKV